MKRQIKDLLKSVRREAQAQMFWTGRNPDCPNFGDLIGPYLYSKFTGRAPKFKSPSNLSLTTEYVTAGSLVHWIRESSIVWGSGAVEQNQKFTQPFKTLAVRGPLTRAAFQNQDFDCPAVFGDPALLVPLVFKPKSPNLESIKIGLVPHYVDQKLLDPEIISNDQFLLIDVFDPVETVFDKINSCTHLISSSLHGLIIAHAFLKPCAWLKLSDDLWGDDTKFYDHFLALEIELDVHLRHETLLLKPDKIAKKIEEFAQPKQSAILHAQKTLLESCPYGNLFTRERSLDAASYFLPMQEGGALPEN